MYVCVGSREVRVLEFVPNLEVQHVEIASAGPASGKGISWYSRRSFLGAKEVANVQLAIIGFVMGRDTNFSGIQLTSTNLFHCPYT